MVGGCNFSHLLFYRANRGAKWGYVCAYYIDVGFFGLVKSVAFGCDVAT